jgi:SSS family solute:Na+ symporter
LVHHPIILAAERGFTALDWAALAAYGLVLAGTGWWFNRRAQKGRVDYFLAGRRMPVWAVAISILATAQSVATFIGVPQAAYLGDLTYLSSNIGGIIGAVILSLFFVPAFYRVGAFTPYQLLEARFGPAAKTAGSAAYLIGRVFATGSRTFIAAIPAAMIVYGDTEPSHLITGILILTSVGVVYTLVGGAGSVIWTDVIQTVIYVGAALLAAGLLLAKIPATIPEIFGALSNPPGGGASKLTVIKTGLDSSRPMMGLDFSQEFTLVTAVIGFSLLTLASHGADNDLVSRQLSCKNQKQAAWSLISGILAGVPAVLLFLCIGLLLHIFYMRPDIMGDRAPTYEITDTRRVFVTFILHEMPRGLAGVMIAGLFAVGLSTINSSLNSMSSAFVNDLYRPLFAGKSEGHFVTAGRMGVVSAGVAVGGFAVLCVYWQQSQGQGLVSFALSVMTFAYAGLLGVFLCALFTKRGNSASAIAALVTGFAVVALFQKPVWEWWTPIVLGESWKSVVVQYPWHLFFGTLASFTVCALPRGTGGTARMPQGAVDVAPDPAQPAPR